MANDTHNEFRPDYAVHPGESLLETIEALGMRQAELARRMGRNKVELSRIIAGRSGITSETALQLERALGVAASFWIALQCHYDEAVARREERARLAVDVGSVKCFPYRKMVRLGWLTTTDDPVGRLRALLDFFGVASMKQWQECWQASEVRFRMSPTLKPDRYALAAWLRQGERTAAAITSALYDEAGFRAALADARTLTKRAPEHFVPRLQEICAPVGVAVTFVPELPGIHASGATRWLSPTRALIQLSLRYRKDDHLWFSFFHECGHVLKHGRRGTFIDNDRQDRESQEEAEANRFAADWLIPPSGYETFVARRDFTRVAITAFADRIGISPGIVVGRLQHDERIAYSACNDLKVRLVWG